MAWQTGTGKHQFRKEASAAKRPQLKLAAMADQQNDETKPKKKKRAQPGFGLKFWWHSVYSKREIAQVSWYRTEAAREAALVNAQKQKQFSGKPKFTRIEKVER